jgi:DNA-directed RNA polymerase subunit L
MMPIHLSKKGDVLEVSLVNEDVALADIIHHELLTDDKVIFAGVAPTHPLLAETKLIIQSKEDPTKTLLASAERAAATIKEMLDKTESSLKKGGV